MPWLDRLLYICSWTTGMDEVIKAKRQLGNQAGNMGSSLRAITIRGAREHNL